MARKRKTIIIEKLAVDHAGAKGKAVGRTPEGVVVFVNGAVPGDVCDVRINKKRRAYLEGTPIHFHHYSDKRVTPACEHFGTCGGCKWQHMNYSDQLFYKQQEVLNNLSRLGGIELPESRPILGAPESYFYRNKMEFSFSDSRWIEQAEVDSGQEITDRNALGFHIPGMWDKVLDIKKCHLQGGPSNAIRLAVKEFALKNDLPFFNLRNQEGLLRTLLIRTSSTGEVMVLIQFFYEDKEKREALLQHIEHTFPELTTLLYTINKKGNDSIYDLDIIPYKGPGHIFEEMEGLRFKIGPKSFYQTNSQQAYALYKVVREFAAITSEDVVYDLYTGTGTIAQFVAAQAQKVVGIESVPEAIDDARENAQNNKLSTVDFYAGDIKELLTTEFIREHGNPDVLITDPPRIGMHQKVVEKILEMAPKRIVYVSCNSATQARDLALLQELYKVSKVQPVDMFPHTHHVENVVLLEKKGEP